VRFAATPTGHRTSRPSSEDRSLAQARRPGSSSAGGITVAGQRRDHTGFAAHCAALGHKSRWAGGSLSQRAGRAGTIGEHAGRLERRPPGRAPRLIPERHLAPPSHTWRGLDTIVPPWAHGGPERHAGRARTIRDHARPREARGPSIPYLEGPAHDCGAVGLMWPGATRRPEPDERRRMSATAFRPSSVHVSHSTSNAMCNASDSQERAGGASTPEFTPPAGWFQRRAALRWRGRSR
jgi:hypothetical protein